MNNRQKAKHWKQLYEGILKESKPIIIQPDPLVCHRANCSIPLSNYVVSLPDTTRENRIMTSLMQEAASILVRHVKWKTNHVTDTVDFSVEFWTRRREEINE